MSITGLPGQGPVRVGIPVADLTAGLFCALGILTALHEREVSGEGQHVCTSLLQAQIFMLDFQASRWLQNQEVAKQAGNDHPTSIPTGVFKTTDGHINIATTGGPIWDRFCVALGAPDMAKHPDYATGKLRSQNRKKLNEEIGAYTAKKSSAEWIDIFNKAGVPSGPIYNIDQVFADPQVKHLGIAQSTPKADGTLLHLVGQPMILSRTPSKMAVRPPVLGEHTDEVLTEFGFSAGEIKALRDAKAV
jgi:formyl-CoA transferase